MGLGWLDLAVHGATLHDHASLSAAQRLERLDEENEHAEVSIEPRPSVRTIDRARNRIDHRVRRFHCCTGPRCNGQAAPAAAAPVVTEPVQPAAPAPTTTLDRIRAAGKIVLGYRTDAGPMSSRDASGKPTGYAVALCGKVAEALKADLSLPSLAVEWVAVGAGYADLEQHRVDLRLRR